LPIEVDEEEIETVSDLSSGGMWHLVRRESRYSLGEACRGRVDLQGGAQ